MLVCTIKDFILKIHWIFAYTENIYKTTDSTFLHAKAQSLIFPSPPVVLKPNPLSFQHSFIILLTIINYAFFEKY